MSSGTTATAFLVNGPPLCRQCVGMDMGSLNLKPQIDSATSEFLQTFNQSQARMSSGTIATAFSVWAGLLCRQCVGVDMGTLYLMGRYIKSSKKKKYLPVCGIATYFHHESGF
ncbi:hypothetical protein CEXT_630201 [Caerostris extrusa]|uniref:Uncharacterized protein n=1 Tax=Caerostris extrusa TaxID=172846 RepID=A0AAV4QQR5_CAEEX|nr:hypothetical protein CEXT_630201 [Caerostris extrusa]